MNWLLMKLKGFFECAGEIMGTVFGQKCPEGMSLEIEPTQQQRDYDLFSGKITRRYLVAGRDVVSVLYMDGLPRMGSSHPDSPKYYIQSIEAFPIGGSLWEVTVKYDSEGDSEDVETSHVPDPANRGQDNQNQLSDDSGGSSHTDSEHREGLSAERGFGGSGISGRGSISRDFPVESGEWDDDRS